MKRLWMISLSFILAIGLLNGCSSVGSDPSTEIKKNILFTLTDVWEITNTESNTTYYYYMAEIQNKTKKDFSTSQIHYQVTDTDHNAIQGIDRQDFPDYTILKGETSFVYGYIGFPNQDQLQTGLYFKDSDTFLPFEKADLRKSDNEQIKEKGNESFTLLDSKELKIDVDASKAKTGFKDGNTVLSHFYITYINQTDKRIVVPYFLPKATLAGIPLSNYSDKGEFDSMSEKELKKINFKENGMPPKTEKISAEATGYILYYLEPEQSLKSDIQFTFPQAAIDYSDKDTQVYTIDLISRAFGSTTTIKLDYK